MLSFRLFAMAVTFILLAQASIQVKAAMVMVDCGGTIRIGIGSTILKAKSVAQEFVRRSIDPSAVRQCVQRLECSNKGWFAYQPPVGPNYERTHIGGVACGFSSREEAISRAKKECRKRGPNCSFMKPFSGYDSGIDQNYSPNIAYICGDRAENC